MTIKEGEFHAQGDILLIKVSNKATKPKGSAIPRDPDAVVLARGETTGHRHAIYETAGVTFYRANEGDGGTMVMDRQAGNNLYLGTLVVEKPVDLKHEEHDTIALDEGTWIVRRQREWDSAQERLVAD